MKGPFKYKYGTGMWYVPYLSCAPSKKRAISEINKLIKIQDNYGIWYKGCGSGYGIIREIFSYPDILKKRTRIRILAAILLWKIQ